MSKRCEACWQIVMIKNELRHNSSKKHLKAFAGKARVFGDEKIRAQIMKTY